MNIGKNLSNFLKLGCLDKVSRGLTQEKRRRRADTWRSTSQLAVLRRTRRWTICIMTPNPIFWPQKLRLFLGIYCLTTFSFRGIFDDPFLGIFFDELFLNKGGRESGALKLPKICVFGLKIQLFQQKRQKNPQFFIVDDTRYQGFDTRYCSLL